MSSYGGLHQSHFRSNATFLERPSLTILSNTGFLHLSHIFCYHSALFFLNNDILLFTQIILNRVCLWLTVNESLLYLNNPSPAHRKVLHKDLLTAEMSVSNELLESCFLTVKSRLLTIIIFLMQLSSQENLNSFYSVNNE